MALFRTRSKAPTVRAEAASTAVVTPATLALLSATVGAGRERAMRIPVVSRARDLHAGLIGTTPLRYYRQTWDGENLVDEPLQPEPWMIRPDRRTSYAHTFSWLFDDLFFYGVAYLHIDARVNGFPSSLSWVPAATVNVQTVLEAGNYPIGGIDGVTVNGQPVPREDLIFFYSPISPLLEAGSRAIVTAERLEQAAQKFASTPIGMGVLKQTSGEPMTSDELQDLASDWVALREEGAIAALNQYTDFIESKMDPSRLQLTEARQHQALELARVANVSPFLVGAPNSSGFTYQNAEQARAQLAQDCLPFLTAIEETLSSDVVTPRGTIVRFDRSIFEATAGIEGVDSDLSPQAQAREVAEIIQKIYLGVANDVVSRDEARAIINQAGGDLG